MQVDDEVQQIQMQSEPDKESQIPILKNMKTPFHHQLFMMPLLQALLLLIMMLILQMRRRTVQLGKHETIILCQSLSMTHRGIRLALRHNQARMARFVMRLASMMQLTASWGLILWVEAATTTN
jgi:hypothetical protein